MRNELIAKIYKYATMTTFIMGLCILDKYNSLERVANILFSKNLDIIKCPKHVQRIVTVVKEHRLPVDMGAQELVNTTEIAEVLYIEIRSQTATQS